MRMDDFSGRDYNGGGKKEIKSRDLEGGRGTQGEVIRGSAGRREVTPAEEEA